MQILKFILLLIANFCLFLAIYRTSLKIYIIRLIRIHKDGKKNINFLAEIILFTIFATLYYYIFTIE